MTGQYQKALRNAKKRPIILFGVGPSGSGKDVILKSLARQMQSDAALWTQLEGTDEVSGPVVHPFRWVSTRTLRRSPTYSEWDIIEPERSSRFIYDPNDFQRQPTRVEREERFAEMGLDHVLRHPDRDGGNYIGFKYDEVRDLAKKGIVTFLSPAKSAKQTAQSLLENIVGAHLFTVGFTSSTAVHQASAREDMLDDPDQARILREYSQEEREHFEALLPFFDYVIANPPVDESDSPRALDRRLHNQVLQLRQIVLYELQKAETVHEQGSHPTLNPFEKDKEYINTNILDYFDSTWAELASTSAQTSQGSVYCPTDSLIALHSLRTRTNRSIIEQTYPTIIGSEMVDGNLQITVQPVDGVPRDPDTIATAIGLVETAFDLNPDTSDDRLRRFVIDNRDDSPDLVLKVRHSKNSSDAYGEQVKPKVDALAKKYLVEDSPIVTTVDSIFIDTLFTETLDLLDRRKPDLEGMDEGIFPFVIKYHERENYWMPVRANNAQAGWSVKRSLQKYKKTGKRKYLNTAAIAVHDYLIPALDHITNNVVRVQTLRFALMEYWQITQDPNVKEKLIRSIDQICEECLVQSNGLIAKTSSNHTDINLYVGPFVTDLLFWAADNADQPRRHDYESIAFRNLETLARITRKGNDFPERATIDGDTLVEYGHLAGFPDEDKFSYVSRLQAWYADTFLFADARYKRKKPYPHNPFKFSTVAVNLIGDLFCIARNAEYDISFDKSLKDPDTYATVSLLLTLQNHSESLKTLGLSSQDIRDVRAKMKLKLLYQRLDYSEYVCSTLRDVCYDSYNDLNKKCSAVQAQALLFELE